MDRQQAKLNRSFDELRYRLALSMNWLALSYNPSILVHISGCKTCLAFGLVPLLFSVDLHFEGFHNMFPIVTYFDLPYIQNHYFRHTLDKYQVHHDLK